MKKTKKETPAGRGSFERRAEGIYQYSSCGTFYARFSFRGKPILRRLGTTENPCTSLPEARRLLGALREDLARSNVTSTRKTLGKLLPEFLASLHISASTLAYKKDALQEFVRFFPTAKKSSEVRKSEILTFLQPIAQKSQGDHNHALTAIRQFFAFSVDDGASFSSPTEGIKYIRKDAKIKRLTPSKAQFDAIVQSIRSVPTSDTAQASGDLVEFMGIAGLGQAECGSLKWGDINFDSGEMAIIRKKTGQQFPVPIYPPLLPLLERLNAEREKPLHSSDKVFKVFNAKKAIDSACERLGFPRYTPRAYRRMFITRAIELGIDIQTIAEWQGHQDGGKLILEVYGKVSKAHQKRMAQLFDDKIITIEEAQKAAI